MTGEGASRTSSSPQGDDSDFFHCLMRSLSAKAGSRSQPISPQLSSNTIPPSYSDTNHLGSATQAPPTPTASTSPQRKRGFSFFGAIEKLKNNLGPQSSHEVEEPQASVRSESAHVSPVVGTSSSPDLNASRDQVFPTTASDVATDPTEPTYLARKIQSLIETLAPSSSPPPLPPKHPNPLGRDSNGRPIPPVGATPIQDPNLAVMLSNATVMNGGGRDERERRVSVWSVLENMDPRSEGDKGVDDGDGEDERSVFSDSSGIMMYSPLIPTTDSLVEIADSEVAQPHLPSPGQDEAAQFAGWMGMWPFSAWNGSSLQAPEIVSGSPIPSLPGSPGRFGKYRMQGQQRVWVPSRTKISLQAVWWGYRMYLPPPVMDILDDKQVEATKRAALITTALTWFFGNIPLNALPVAVRPAVLLFQTIVPYIGYLGTFVSWSWSSIKSYDQGNGVILTATWLLPVALIPSTWEAPDFPSGSSSAFSTPLPPSPSPPMSPLPTSGTPAPPYMPATPSNLAPSVPSQEPLSQFPTPEPLQALSPQQTLLSPLSATTPLLSLPKHLPSTSAVPPSASPLLPAWIPPPPTPTLPITPLPELDPDEAGVQSPSSRFVTKKGNYKNDSNVATEKRKDGERRKEKSGKTKFKAVMSPLIGARSSSHGSRKSGNGASGVF